MKLAGSALTCFRLSRVSDVDQAAADVSCDRLVRSPDVAPLRRSIKEEEATETPHPNRSLHLLYSRSRDPARQVDFGLGSAPALVRRLQTPPRTVITFALHSCSSRVDVDQGQAVRLDASSGEGGRRWRGASRRYTSSRADQRFDVSGELANAVAVVGAVHGTTLGPGVGSDSGAGRPSVSPAWASARRVSSTVVST